MHYPCMACTGGGRRQGLGPPRCSVRAAPAGDIAPRAGTAAQQVILVWGKGQERDWVHHWRGSASQNAAFYPEGVMHGCGSGLRVWQPRPRSAVGGAGSMP